MKASTFRAHGLMCAAAALLAVITQAAHAEPLVGQQLKFSQQPMIATTINNNVYNGHDELSTLYGSPDPTGVVKDYVGTAMADDFADPITTPVVHVRWWGRT